MSISKNGKSNLRGLTVFQVKQAYSTTFTSDEIEKTYLANPEGQMKFCTEGHEYLLDFPKMVQKNVKIGTERAVRRRPVFVKELKQ